MERFFGGNPLAVTLRLIIISIVAGDTGTDKGGAKPRS